MGATALGGEVSNNNDLQSFANDAPSSVVSNDVNTNAQPEVTREGDTLFVSISLKKGEKLEDAKVKAVEYISAAVGCEEAGGVELSSVKPTADGAILTFTLELPEGCELPSGL
jgi:hypothetical protein